MSELQKRGLHKRGLRKMFEVRRADGDPNRHPRPTARNDDGNGDGNGDVTHVRFS